MSRYTTNHIIGATSISFIFFLVSYTISLNLPISAVLSIFVCVAYFVLLFVVDLRHDDPLLGQEEEEEVVIKLKKK